MSAPDINRLSETCASYEAARSQAHDYLRNALISIGVFVGFILFLAGSQGGLILDRHPLTRVMLCASLLAGVRATYRWLRVLPSLHQRKRSPSFENAVYEVIAGEADGEDRQPGLWARALANSGGDERAAKGFYLRMRAQELKDQLGIEAKSKAKKWPSSDSSGWVLLWVFVISAVVKWFVWLGDVPDQQPTAKPIVAAQTEIASDATVAVGMVTPEPSKPITRADAEQRARFTDAEEKEWFTLCRRYGPDLSNAPKVQTLGGEFAPMAAWLASRRQVLSDWRSRVDPSQCSRATLDQYYRAEDQYEDLVKQYVGQVKQSGTALN